ncbi:GNAT family N-acetyltransferase [Halobacillus sp. A5]|uniref:GNAT family N-acetyltransferase n=1 Tax=Halobacillus sp. A5 TaxID=2880263 RepID=UPI0020A6624A|nr:GNAT family N-acetyltransferase [Halobacillus sp. A5]MCP3028912.1 GNAT family N-acetyltransferase [Halobacillus sp. A5]
MDQILMDFPHEFETQRLHIRLPLPGDGKKVYQAIQASLHEIKPWLPFAQHDQTEEETEVNIRHAHINFLKREDLRMLGFHKETGELVCSTGLHRMNWDVPKFEIGYWVDSRYSGKGYTTEAVDGLTRFAFRELHAKRVEIRCDAINHRSRAIPAKLNFQLEGILRNEDVSVDGLEVRDTCIYAKVKT